MPFEWTDQAEQAALIIAQSPIEIGDRSLADRVGVTAAQVRTWRRMTLFEARVGEMRAERATAALAESLANQAYRLKKLAMLWARAETIWTQRGLATAIFAREQNRIIPGAESGFMVRTMKVIGKGDMAQLVEEWAFDAALMREARGLLEQAAKETGTYGDGAANVNVGVGVTVEHIYEGVDLSKV